MTKDELAKAIKAKEAQISEYEQVIKEATPKVEKKSKTR